MVICLWKASHASSKLHKILHSINTPKAEAFHVISRVFGLEFDFTPYLESSCLVFRCIYWQSAWCLQVAFFGSTCFDLFFSSLFWFKGHVAEHLHQEEESLHGGKLSSSVTKGGGSEPRSARWKKHLLLFEQHKGIECEDRFDRTPCPWNALQVSFASRKMRVIFKRYGHFMSQEMQCFLHQRSSYVWSFKPCRKIIIKRHRDSVWIGFRRSEIESQ